MNNNNNDSPPRTVPPALRIPSFLYEGEKVENPKEGRLDESDEDIIMSSIDCKGEPAACIGNEVYVVFYSGGKDSMLALRALIKRYKEGKDKCDSESADSRILKNVVLLTTYDATNNLTNNKISLDIITKQAKTLKIPLIAVPLYHASNDRYSKRIKLALDLIHRRIFNKTSEEIEKINSVDSPDSSKIETILVFGDLGIEHLRLWRDQELKSGLPPYKLEYPLWKVPYEDLYSDLEKSGVACIISNIDYTAIKTGTETAENFEDFGDDDDDDDIGVVANTEKQEEKQVDVSFSIGDIFDRKLFDELMAEDSFIDAFGENGEFDTIVEVWGIDRKVALGLI